MAKALCSLPDDAHSVDRALERLRAAGEAPTGADLREAAASARTGVEDRRAAFAADPRNRTVDVGQERYRLDVVAPDDAVRLATAPLPALAAPPAPAAAARPRTGRHARLELSTSASRQVAQAVPLPSGPDAGTLPNAATPSPGATVPPFGTAPAPAASAAGSPDASASGVASPSPVATVFVPAALPGPGTLIAPTPRSTAASAPTPPPIPTATPLAPETGPVILSNPTGAPTIPDAGPSASPTPYVPYHSAAATPAPTPTGSPQPRPLGTLAPNQLAILADRGDASTRDHTPGDFDGNVHIFYATGQIVGDHAHYDGDHTLTVTGHTYLINRAQDSILYADEIDFDTVARRAVLVGGRGETTEGVDVGKLHYSAQRIRSLGGGATHAERASFTTCDKPHSGYHVNARYIDVMPGQKIVAHNATIFLGALAIFYLPLLVIPLKTFTDPRRQTGFLPLFGYSKTEGAFVKARISFDASDTYYGYYRVEYFTKRGLGLGYDAYIGTKNFRRSATIDSYTISDRITNTRQTNINATETENLAANLRGQFALNYTGDFGAGVSLPASFNLNGSLIHSGPVSTENLTFSRFTQGKISDTYNLALIDSLNLSRNLSQQFNFSYSKYNSQIATSNTFHINTLTHYFAPFADLNLRYDKTDFSAQPFGFDSVPELQIMPHINFHGFRYPFTTQLTVGEYTEPQNHFSTQRAQGVLNYPFYARVGTSDFNAGLNVTQDYYGTGDQKGFVTQNASLSTPYGNHLVNSVTYNEANPLGPADVPFQLLDRLSGGSHSAQDVLRIFNGNIYSVQLATGTSFNRQAQPLNYQIAVRPSPRSLLLLGGFYQPGPGNGFNQTNVQGIVPLGPYTDVQFSTNVDYKNKFRLIDKNFYLTKIIDCCYRLQGSYNQDLKQFNLTADLLAFPGQSTGFGLGGSQQQAILPQSFSF